MPPVEFTHIFMVFSTHHTTHIHAITQVYRGHIESCDGQKFTSECFESLFHFCRNRISIFKRFHFIDSIHCFFVLQKINSHRSQSTVKHVAVSILVRTVVLGNFMSLIINVNVSIYLCQNTEKPFQTLQQNRESTEIAATEMERRASERASERAREKNREREKEKEIQKQIICYYFLERQ